MDREVSRVPLDIVKGAVPSFQPRARFDLSLPHGGRLVLGERALVMGILNVTPDSFAERASRLDPGEALDAGLRMQAAGADLIDIGGESTRPGAEPLSGGEELDRVLPVIRALAGRLTIPISIDTYKSAVARAAVEAGADIVNDISGLRRDSALAGIARETGAPLILMHSRGTPATMADEAVYSDLVGEVVAELTESIGAAEADGVLPGQIIVDPGIGFAKRAEHSYGVLARLGRIAALLGRPLLLGASRKSFMRQALQDRPAVERDWGTAAAETAAVLAGAHIVRVHAVAEMAQVVRVAEEIRRHQSA
jgi:dihydropteroate synthase